MLDDEATEGLALLLGGITTDSFGNEAWDNQSVDECGEKGDFEEEIGHVSKQQVVKEKVLFSKLISASKNDLNAYSLAYSCCGDAVKGPQVQVVNIEGKGKALVSTAAVSKGEVLFTESAAAPLHLNDVPACSWCHTSLASIHSCSITEPLPDEHLWPVIPLDFSSNIIDEGYRVDKYERRRCQKCQTTFCSRGCLTSFSTNLGSCCTFARIKSCLDEDTQSAVLLAARMFIASTHSLRKRRKLTDYPSMLCGTEEDCTVLDLGMMKEGVLTLEPLYRLLITTLKLSEKEQEPLSISYLGSLAAKAARNSFGIQPTSPFQTYYSALIRSHGGRNASEKTRQQVWKALNVEPVPGCDTIVNARVTPEVAAIFGLTANINHDCEPNCCISSSFVDARIDVVALRDIAVGEEITISYVPPRLRFQQRQRELRAKYLFDCTCYRCRRGE